MTTAYIYDAVRTPRSRGKMGVGTLSEVKPINLLSGLLKGLQERHDLDTSLVDDVLMGCVTPMSEQGSDIARCAVMHAGWDESVPGVQLDRFCASGLEAVNSAAAKVASGMESLVVAGGVEAMSRVGMGSNGGPFLADPEFIVLPVTDRNGMSILQRDDFIKPNTSTETLGALRASFVQMGAAGFDDMAKRKYPQVMDINHVHTAGNSSGIVDGASAVLIGNKAMGEAMGIQPRGRIVATAVLATDPVIMLTGPGPAAKKCLQKAGLTVTDIDLWEINEAFASVALRYMRDLGIDDSITNVNGGAIAMGHPLGATGGCLVSVVLDELERRDAKRAMISLCVGGGMGISTLIERV